VTPSSHPWRRLWALAGLAIACFLPAPALAAGAPNDGFFGVNPGDLFKLPQAQWDPHLTAIAADGVQVVRVGAWWSDLEPAPPVGGQHQYAWGDLDQQIGALARHGLRAEPLLSFSATWASRARGDYTASPDGSGDFAAFARAVAQRYGRGGSFWRAHPDLPAVPATAYEVWNEENATAYWHPAGAAPEEYADLYAAARGAIHQADDAARVVVGGLAAADNNAVLAPEDFVRRMYAHRPGLRGAVDAVGFHPYARDPRGVYKLLAGFRSALDATAGPGVPIEVTEIGWTTADTPEQRRAAYLLELAQTLPRSDCGVERLEAYAWLGPEHDAGDREQWFGIANADGTNKPSAEAYARGVRLLRGLAGAVPAGTVPICSGTAVRRVHLKLSVAVRRTPRHAGRLIITARCTTGCRICVDVRVPRRHRSAIAAGGAGSLRRTTRFRAGRQTVTVNVAKRVARRAMRLRVKITAIDRTGAHVTRTLRVRR
jgi:polysaccharide biosynthesis protein PslG